MKKRYWECGNAFFKRHATTTDCWILSSVADVSQRNSYYTVHISKEHTKKPPNEHYTMCIVYFCSFFFFGFGAAIRFSVVFIILFVCVLCSFVDWSLLNAFLPDHIVFVLFVLFLRSLWICKYICFFVQKFDSVKNRDPLCPSISRNIHSFEQSKWSSSQKHWEIIRIRHHHTPISNTQRFRTFRCLTSRWYWLVFYMYEYIYVVTMDLSVVAEYFVIGSDHIQSQTSVWMAFHTKNDSTGNRASKLIVRDTQQ